MGRRITLLAAALLALSGWAYHGLYRSTDAAIQLAEAFDFRRMRAVRLGARDAYRFFFVTNREAEGEGGLEQTLGNVRREEGLRSGTFDAVIAPTLGIGMLINPTEWFQNEVIEIDSLRELDRATLVAELREAVAASPYRSLLIVVHGFREGFPSALRKTAFVGHVLDIDTPVLLFDWPGDQGSLLGGYRRARTVADASGADLAKTLAWIDEEVAPERLWLIANSMGAQVVAKAFAALYGDPRWSDAESEIEDVVLTAPDVDADEFDERFKSEINAFARNLTVYVSSNDRALVMSRWVNRSARRGESTLSPDQLEEAVRLAELIDPDSQLVTLVDVTPVNRTRNFHNFSLETPEFFDDLFLRLTNAETPQSRGLYATRTPEGTVYWVLTRGR